MIKKVGFIIEERYLKDDYPRVFLNRCIEQGIETEIIVTNSETNSINNFKPSSDIYFHRNHTNQGLAYLAIASKYNKTINSFYSVLSCQNKTIMYSLLCHSKAIKVPQIYSYAEISSGKVDYPIIVKPIYGNNSEGIMIFDNRQQVIDNISKNFIIQKYIYNKNFDIKLYYVNGKITAVRKKSKIHQVQVQSKKIIVIPEFVNIVEECRKIFGLNLFGVDLIEDLNGTYYVVDINECCSFTLVDNLEQELIDYIELCQ